MRRERQLLRAPRRPVRAAAPRASPARSAAASPAVLQRLNQVAGNRGVARLLQRVPTLEAPLVPKSVDVTVMDRIRDLLDIRLWGPEDPRAPIRVRELIEAMRDLPIWDGKLLVGTLRGEVAEAPPAVLELRKRFETLHPISQGRIIFALEQKLHHYAEMKRSEAPERARFEKELPEAVKTFEHFKFGRAVKPRTDKKGNVLNLHYDETFWDLIDDPEFDKCLKLKSGTKPSAALEAMVASPKKWSFDCGEWVQAANNLAWLKALGADEFDRRMGSEDFLLRPQWAGSQKPEVKFQREGPGDKFSRITEAAGREDDERKDEELLALAPIGSRITWSSTIPTSRTGRTRTRSRSREDQYAAHGFHGKSVFSAAELELRYGEKIAKIKKVSGDDAYMSVFLKVVELYKTPDK